MEIAFWGEGMGRLVSLEGGLEGEREGGGLAMMGDGVWRGFRESWSSITDYTHVIRR